ncbi:unnamed protein product [Pleuronectes platessa]|uniref:Uncharacterized protein n=1 Tax=Pleuronectes platessa TaxID=8262 RepID=A0A9N7V0B9_PLEPL|nr:unnamed protein product [Pleuronectes platessa]
MADLKIAVHRRSPSNLTELHLFCQEEWTNLSISRCAKLVETYPKRLAAVIAAKGGSTKFDTGGTTEKPNTQQQKPEHSPAAAEPRWRQEPGHKANVQKLGKKTLWCEQPQASRDGH